MDLNEPLLDPFNNVVLESALDYLMEEVGSDHLVDVRSGEMGREGLWADNECQHYTQGNSNYNTLTLTLSTMPYSSHSLSVGHESSRSSVCSRQRKD